MSKPRPAESVDVETFDGPWLRPRQRRELITLLGHFQNELESAIDCHTIDGRYSADLHDKRVVADARRKWALAEKYVKLLSEGK